MTWLLSKLMGYLLPGVAIALAVALLAVGVQTHRVKIAKSETVQVQTAWQADRAHAQAEALRVTTEYRAKEAADAARLKGVQDGYDALQTVHASALAGQRAVLADNGRLRNAVAAYAAGGGSAAPDTAAAASERAARLGELLAAALQADAEHAAAAESNGDAVRALLAAWPHD